MVRTGIIVLFYGQGPSTGTQGDLHIYTPLVKQLIISVVVYIRSITVQWGETTGKKPMQ